MMLEQIYVRSMYWFTVWYPRNDIWYRLLGVSSLGDMPGESWISLRGLDVPLTIPVSRLGSS